MRRAPPSPIKRGYVLQHSRENGGSKLFTITSSSESREERFEGKLQNDRFEAEVRRGGSLETLSIPVSDSTEFDCLSPVFNTITFHRLRLRRGETKEIEVVYIFPVSTEASIQTRMLKQRYRRLSDESVIVPACRFPSAKRYVYTNLESGWTSSIWTDNLETILRYEGLCELLSYNRSD